MSKTSIINIGFFIANAKKNRVADKESEYFCSHNNADIAQ